MLLNISQTINGFSVVFGFENKLFQGEIPTYLMPANPKQTTYQEYESKYFKSWADYITNNLSSDVKEEIKEQQVVEEIVNCPLLTHKDGCYYRLNSSVSLPKEIASEYIKYQDDVDKVQALDNFWSLCCANTDVVRESLFTWLQKDNWKITSKGMLVTYRNVIPYESELDKKAKEFYSKIKNQKKSPKNYFINVGEVISLTKQPTSINLKECYNNIKPTYTHSYNGELRHYYKIGEEATIDRSYCDDSIYNTCSKGFHVMSKSFLEKQGQKYFGEVTICCLVSPSNVVSCPTEENYNKMRTCAFIPICEVDWLNDTIIEPLNDFLEDCSNQYLQDTVVDLASFIETSFDDGNPKFIGLNKTEIQERLIVTI